MNDSADDDDADDRVSTHAVFYFGTLWWELNRRVVVLQPRRTSTVRYVTRVVVVVP